MNLRCGRLKSYSKKDVQCKLKVPHQWLRPSTTLHMHINFGERGAEHKP